MAFSKSFPKTTDKYPVWEKVSLTEREEREVEKAAKEEHIKLMKECIDEAKKIIEDKKLKNYQSDIMQIAFALFEKMASHSVYWKERSCKEKFEKESKSLIAKP